MECERCALGLVQLVVMESDKICAYLYCHSDEVIAITKHYTVCICIKQYKFVKHYNPNLYRIYRKLQVSV